MRFGIEARGCQLVYLVSIVELSCTISEGGMVLDLLRAYKFLCSSSPQIAEVDYEALPEGLYSPLVGQVVQR